MTDVVVAPGVTSFGLLLGFNDTLTVSSGGTISFSSLQGTNIVIQSGGEAVHDLLTDYAHEQVSGTDILGFVGNGSEMVILPGGVGKYVHAVAGGELDVFGGGTTNLSPGITDSAYVELGGVMSVSEDGQAVATTVSSGGEMVVSSGIATDSYIYGGEETVAGAGSVDTGAYVFSGGALLALSGGLCSGTVAFDGGVVVAVSGGELQSATLGSGGVDIVSANSLALQTTVEGGEELISGGTALQTTLIGGLQIVDGGVDGDGGSGDTVVSSGGEQLVVSSGLGQVTSVMSGGSAAVETGGDLSGAVVSSGGVVIERYFGSSTNTNLMAGGVDLVESGGLAILAQVAGSQQVSGGETSATTVVAGGQETVLSGGLASGTVVSSGGNLTISSGGAADGAKVFAGGSLIVDGTLTTDATITVAGHLALGGAAAGLRTLDGTGTLALTGGGSTIGAGAVLSIAHLTQGDATLTAAASFTYGGTWTQTKGWISVDLSKTLTLTGIGDRFSGTFNGAGTADFAGGSDLLSGTRLLTSAVVDGAHVTLAGDIDLAKTATVTSPDLTIAAAGATLSGGGDLRLTNLASNRIVGAAATATLTNVNDTIEGAGDLGGGAMVLDNQIGGVIASIDGAVLVIDTGANAITNTGTIASEGAGGLTIRSAVVNDGVLGVTAGTLTLNAAVSGTGLVEIDAGTADFAAAFSQNVEFQDTTGVLELAKSQAYTGAITGFSLTGGTALDLRDIGFTSGKTKASFTENGAKTQGVLTVTDGTHTALITLVGNYSGSTFTTSSDGHGGTTVVDPHAKPAAIPRAPVAVLPFIAAMAGFGAGGGHWVPTAESGRSGPHLLAAARLS
jgi:autotransporter passenger strand-loop-strand repeat protein